MPCGLCMDYTRPGSGGCGVGGEMAKWSNGQMAKLGWILGGEVFSGVGRVG